MHEATSRRGLHVVQNPGQFDLCRGHRRLYRFSLEMHCNTFQTAVGPLWCFLGLLLPLLTDRKPHVIFLFPSLHLTSDDLDSPHQGHDVLKLL